MKRNAGLIGVKHALSGEAETNSTSGIFDTFDQHMLSPLWPTTKKYISCTESTSTVAEDASMNFAVVTSGFADITLYYTFNTVSGTTMTDADLSAGGTVQGSFTLSSNAATLNFSFLAEFGGLTENNVFKLEIRTGSTSGTVVMESGNVTVTDVVGTESLPEDVVFYCPFDDSTSTSAANITCYTSTAGATTFTAHTDLWSSYNNGEIISTPGTNPMGYSTCYNPGENGTGGGLSTDTTKGNALFEDICYGVTTNISIELLFYLGTNSNQGSSWTRIYGWSEWYAPGDGFNAEFYSSSDNRIAFANFYGSGNNKKGTNISSMDTTTWYRVLQIWDLTNGTATIFLENQNGSSGNSITSLPRIYTTSYSNTAFEQTHDTGTSMANLNMGAAASGTSYRYNGGISELIVRVNTADMSTITASNPYVVNGDSLL